MDTPNLKQCQKRQELRRAYQAFGSDVDLTKLGCSPGQYLGRSKWV